MKIDKLACKHKRLFTERHDVHPPHHVLFASYQSYQLSAVAHIVGVFDCFLMFVYNFVVKPIEMGQMTTFFVL